VTAAITVPLARIEAGRLPSPTRSRARLAAASIIGVGVVVGLLALGTTPLTAAAGVVLMIAALRLARTAAR